MILLTKKTIQNIKFSNKIVQKSVYKYKNLIKIVLHIYR